MPTYHTNQLMPTAAMLPSLLLRGSDPIPRDVFLGIELLGCFPRGYFVLLGIRRIFELL